eukprot:TRINITY_DN1653_c0_g1_i12.p1 TRINITY_DN1653_c0_g1~~TRINITY_DN1653_c0_g1_i12.p1  ORF type:complete len:220 (-),score=43.85 TRINITY_DN1653_c0_g1_i12:480-1139(-)
MLRSLVGSEMCIRDRLGDITDMTGQVPGSTTQEADGIFTATIDLDATLFHVNFNNFSQLLADYQGQIETVGLAGYCSTPGNCSATADLLQESGFVMLARTDKGYENGVSVRTLKDRYNLTDLRTYQHQSRHAINMQRMTATPNVRPWPYPRNGQPYHNGTREVADSQGASAQEPDLRQAVGTGQTSGQPERRELVPVKGFVKAQGTRGWWGVTDQSRGS